MWMVSAPSGAVTRPRVRSPIAYRPIAFGTSGPPFAVYMVSDQKPSTGGRSSGGNVIRWDRSPVSDAPSTSTFATG